MKRLILLKILALYSGVVFSSTVTIVNSGFTFSPDDITINAGDIIDFQLGGSHNAVEVSEATWTNNGNSPLPGFSVPFGGGQVAGLTTGIHYYVCAPHSSLGMKGKITVAGASDINDQEAGAPQFSIYPNPSQGKFTIDLTGLKSPQGGLTGVDQQMRIEVYDQTGKKVFEQPENNLQELNMIDISSETNGIYFVRINDRKKVFIQRMVKE